MINGDTKPPTNAPILITANDEPMILIEIHLYGSPKNPVKAAIENSVIKYNIASVNTMLVEEMNTTNMVLTLVLIIKLFVLLAKYLLITIPDPAMAIAMTIELIVNITEVELLVILKLAAKTDGNQDNNPTATRLLKRLFQPAIGETFGALAFSSVRVS